jgi:hypothetical protein
MEVVDPFTQIIAHTQTHAYIHTPNMFQKFAHHNKPQFIVTSHCTFTWNENCNKRDFHHSCTHDSHYLRLRKEYFGSVRRRSCISGKHTAHEQQVATVQSCLIAFFYSFFFKARRHRSNWSTANTGRQSLTTEKTLRLYVQHYLP